MKGLVLGLGIAALGCLAVAPAQADFAVVKFKETGACRAWYDPGTKPWGTTQMLWVKQASWDVSQTRGEYAMKHHWCKAWYK